MANLWSYSASGVTQGFTLTATAAVQTVCLDDENQMSSCEVVLHLTEINDAVAIVLFSSGDGRSRWEFWADNAGNVSVQQVINGVITVGPTVLTNGHSVTTGIPYALSVFLTGNTAIVRVDAGDAVAAAQDNTYLFPNADLANFRKWGFGSSVNGARVLDATQYQIALIESARTEVLVVIANGELWVCKDADGNQLSLVETGVVGTGRVGIAEFGGLAYIVGGGRAVNYDPITDRVSDWYDTEHTYSATPSNISTLPGATQPTAALTTSGRGTTGCDIIEVNNERIILSGWEQRPEVAFCSESGNPNSFRVLNINAGEASAFTANAQDRITCLRSLPTGNLLVGCRSTTRMLIGDPLLGQTTFPKIADSGISGPYAAIKNDVGLTAYHSPVGLFQITQGSILPQDFSSDTLTETIQIDAADIKNFIVSLVRDPKDRLLYCFLTPAEGDTAGVHIVYNERPGQYRASAGYFFPEQYPATVGPTAAVLWRGKVLLGTRNGMILTFNPDAREALDTYAPGLTTPVSSKMMTTMVAAAHPVGDSIVTSWRALLADTSGSVVAEIFGGATAETLFDFSKNQLLFTTSLAPFAPPVCEHVRSPAIALRITNPGEVATYWELEQIVGNFETGTMVSSVRAIASGATPPAPGRPPGAAAAPKTNPIEPTGGLTAESSVPTEGYGGSGSVSAGVKKV